MKIIPYEKKFCVFFLSLGASHYSLAGGVGKILGGSDVENWILWGGQMFEIGFYGGVRSSKSEKMGGSYVAILHISLGVSNVQNTYLNNPKCRLFHTLGCKLPTICGYIINTYKGITFSCLHFSILFLSNHFYVYKNVIHSGGVGS